MAEQPAGRYVPPQYGADAFHCTCCGVYAHQSWAPNVIAHVTSGRGYQELNVPRLAVSYCSHCGESTLWIDQKMVYPRARGAPMPNPDMPADVRTDYEEAAQVLQDSPRSAAALLRLAIQKLCVELGQPGKNLDHDIAALVKDGLRVEIQQALDIVRVVGNNAVHPGELDLKDDYCYMCISVRIGQHDR